MNHIPFGHFDDEAREFVITTPRTPRPWQIRLFSERLTLEVTNHGTGVTYEKDLKGRFTLFNYTSHRYLYVRDGETGEVWSPAWLPTRTELDHYECRHGLGYTRLTGRKDDLEVSWHLAIPPDGDDTPREIWWITATNLGPKTKQFAITPFTRVSLPFRDAYHGEVNLFRSEADPGRRWLYIKNWAYPRDAEDYALGLASTIPFSGYELKTEAFLKDYSSFERPHTVAADNFSESEVTGGAPCLSARYAFTLQPGERTAFGLVMRVAESSAQIATEAAAITQQDLWTPVRDALTKLHAPLLATNHMTSADPGFDRLVNVWVKKQSHYNAVWNRGWGMGFRDCMQDMDVWRIFEPARARARLLDAAAAIYPDGHTLRKWAPRDTKPYFDGGVWFVNSLTNYVAETGDASILSAPAPWVDEPTTATVLEHGKQAMRFLAETTGPDGICRMGYGDWNDALDRVDQHGQGQSVWTTMAFLWGLDRFLELLDHLGDHDLADLRETGDRMRAVLNERFWDGQWYQRAKTDAGEIVGGQHCEEGQIYLNAQSWAILSRTADPARAKACLASVSQRLMTDYGPLLLAPAYSKHRPDIGRITGDRPGFVENGSNYVHATMFYIHALYTAGLAEEAWDALSRVLPQNPRNPTTNSELEPYLLTNSFHGPGSEKPGKALFPWRTGTSCWFLKIVWEDLLGFFPTFDGLRIAPQLPKTLQAAPLSVVHQTRTGDITVDLVGGERAAYDLVISAGETIPWNQLRKGMTIRVT